MTTWDGTKGFIRISGLADSNYATCPVTRQQIVSRYGVFLEKAPVGMRSAQQQTVALLSAEAELGLGYSMCTRNALPVAIDAFYEFGGGAAYDSWNRQ